MKEKSIFIFMISTSIIAIYEINSLLRKKMCSAPRGGLGDD